MKRRPDIRLYDTPDSTTRASGASDRNTDTLMCIVAFRGRIDVSYGLTKKNNADAQTRHTTGAFVSSRRTSVSQRRRFALLYLRLRANRTRRDTARAARASVCGASVTRTANARQREQTNDRPPTPYQHGLTNYVIIFRHTYYYNIPSLSPNKQTKIHIDTTTAHARSHYRMNIGNDTTK